MIEHLVRCRRIVALVSGLLLAVCATSCSRKTPITRDSAEAGPSAQPSVRPGGDYDTLWCRGGGKSLANHELTIYGFRAGQRGSAIETKFEFEKSAKPAGGDGSALEPGTCAYADRLYEADPVRLTYVEEGTAVIHWTSTSKGTTAPTVLVAADGVRSSSWLMEAKVTKKAYVGSFQVHEKRGSP